LTPSNESIRRLARPIDTMLSANGIQDNANEKGAQSSRNNETRAPSKRNVITLIE
jgi:hypothetical protein